MTIDINYLHMPVSESLSNFVTNKLNKLGAKYSWIIRAEVLFKQENNPSENNKICEIKLSVPGQNLFAQTNETFFEKAAVATLDSIEKQLKKRKEILTRH